MLLSTACSTTSSKISTCACDNFQDFLEESKQPWTAGATLPLVVLKNENMTRATRIQENTGEKQGSRTSTPGNTSISHLKHEKARNSSEQELR
jgi:hypothetical protein